MVNKNFKPEVLAYTCEQASAMMQLSLQTVRRLCQKGEIKSIYTHSGYRITRQAMMDFLEGKIILR